MVPFQLHGNTALYCVPLRSTLQVFVLLQQALSPECFRQLDLAPFDRLIWPHPLVNPLSAAGRSEALRRP